MLLNSVLSSDGQCGGHLDRLGERVGTAAMVHEWPCFKRSQAERIAERTGWGCGNHGCMHGIRQGHA